MDPRLLINWPLDYWSSKEWRDVNKRLDDLEKDGILFNPNRAVMLRSLDLCSLASCRVCILGEGPYPDPKHATGVAFSAGYPGSKDIGFPASLRTILGEYCNDLHYEWPSGPCLERWCEQGVLLLNTTPTIEIERDGNRWKTYTHRYWAEWSALTREIITKLSDKGFVVFAFLGRQAAEYSKYVRTDNNLNHCLFRVHPSPLAQRSATEKFIGSRFFTTINDRLRELGKEPIDWRLE
jgi:uracil-DNA glycosylase